MLSDYWTFTWFIHLLCSVPSPFVQCRWGWWGLRHRLLPTWGSNERTFQTLNFICITCIYKFFIYLQQNALYTTVLNGDGKFSLQWPGTLISVERKGDCRVNTCFLHTTFNTQLGNEYTSYLNPRLLPPILLPWPQPFVDSFSSHDLACHHQTVTSVQSQCASVSPTVRRRRAHLLFVCEPCKYENTSLCLHHGLTEMGV